MQAARTDGVSKRGVRAPRPSLALFGWSISSFQFLGVFGFVCAGGTALVLASALGLSVPIFVALIVAAAVTFFALVVVTRGVLGEERIVYYHHEIAVLAVSALVVAALGRPVLAYLDVVMVAMGVFLVFGRLGCASVGCCHGMPHAFGWRYGHEHADAGFPRAFVGVSLVPVQPIESLAVLALTFWASFQLLSGSEPGSVLAAQLAAYAFMRFFLEFARGDTLRPVWNGFSEAQWTSLAIALAVVGAGRAGWLPVAPWQTVVAACVVAGCVVVGLVRLRRGSTHRLLSPVHVQEVAGALADWTEERGERGPAPVRIRTTSLGVRLSSCVVADGDARVELCTLSGVDGRAARALSLLICRLRSLEAAGTFVERRKGLFQLVMNTRSPDA